VLGRVVDPETGLIYLRNRYYDPTTGQFLSRDPLAVLTGSPYGYVGGDPLNGSDPSGLAPLADGGTASYWANQGCQADSGICSLARGGSFVDTYNYGAAGTATCQQPSANVLASGGVRGGNPIGQLKGISANEAEDRH
jgi:RHS repeat-associated protein